MKRTEPGSAQREDVGVGGWRAAPSDRPEAAIATAAPAPALVWSDTLVTSHAAMDATHRSFVAVANELVAADDAALLDRLRVFEAHARAHFGEEDALMRNTGYPSSGCHIEEHGAVLKSVAEVIDLVSQGDLAIGRDLAAELVRWFPEHTHHMDKGLAAWVCKLSTGGAPLVLRRDRGAGMASRL